jgi:HAD superfamily hydrolase (TIGR01509 family)
VNGVLLDAASLMKQAFMATAERGGFPFTEPDFHVVKSLWLLDAYRLLDPRGDAFARREFHVRYCRARAAEVRAYPGVRDVLTRARAAGVRIAAATSHGAMAEACLVATGLYPLIDCLLTQEEVKRPKPDPEVILRILNLFDIQPHETASDVIYVGDTPADVQAGQAARVRTVGTTYGLSSDAEIRRARPDVVIHAFGDLLSLRADLVRRDAIGVGSFPRKSNTS